MINYLLLTTVLLGGLALILMVGTTKGMPYAPIWSRTAVRLAGSCNVLWAILKTIQINHMVMHDTMAGRLLQSFKLFCGGMTVGILITIFISGAFNKRSTTSKETS